MTIQPPPRTVLISSSKGLNQPLYQKHSQNHIVLCDATTGKVHIATCKIDANPEDENAWKQYYKFDDAKVIATVVTSKLIQFENLLGRETGVQNQIERLDLSPEEAKRVNAAHENRYNNTPKRNGPRAHNRFGSYDS